MRRVLGARKSLGHQENGFTLIEVLVAVVLLSVCLIGMAQFFASAGDRVMDSETRSLLHQIATQEIEDIRALPYEDIGTVSGNPPGSLPEFEEKTIEGVPIEIRREISYVTDDSYSGPYPANYRRVTVIVEAADSDELDPMQLSTFVGGGAEGGTLDITVTDAAGEPVPDARLEIINDSLIPHVHIDSSAIRTDVNGHLLVPGLEPDGSNGYFVIATKNGYNDAATPTGLVVQKGTPFTVVQLIIDELTGLTLHLTDGTGVPVANETLMVSGHLSVEPWTFVEEATTDDEGYATLTGLRYSTSLEPLIIQTVLAHDPVLQLPSGIDPDPVDGSVTLESGQIGVIIDPGTQRDLELVLPPAP